MAMVAKEKQKKQKDLIAAFVPHLPVLRKMLRWSQEDLAQRIGITRQTVCAIELGKYDISWTTFLACIMVFTSNESTAAYLQHVNILNDDLRDTMR